MASQINEFDFDSLEPIEVKGIKYKGSEYVLREATGDAAGKYRAASLRGMELVQDDDGNRTTKNLQGIAEVEPLLVSLCLFTNSTQFPVVFDRPVSLDAVKQFPSRMQKKLFDTVKEISELDEKEDLPTLEKQLTKLTAKIAKLRSKESAKNVLAS